MSHIVLNIDQDTLAKMDKAASARSLSRDEFIKKAALDISGDDEKLAAIVAQSRAQIAHGQYFTQAQAETDAIELIREIDNLP